MHQASYHRSAGLDKALEKVLFIDPFFLLLFVFRTPFYVFAGTHVCVHKKKSIKLQRSFFNQLEPKFDYAQQ